MIFLYSVFAIPAIYLHLEYIVKDWNVSLIIDNSNKKVTYRKGTKEIIFNFDEIENMSFFGETKDFNNLTTQNHSFYVFKIKNNKSFIISCLVIRNVENILPMVNINKNRSLFPSIIFENDAIKKSM